MIYLFSRKLAINLKSHYPNVGLSINKIEHGIIWMILNPIMLSIVLLYGLLFNHFLEVFLSLSFCVLRIFSGGRHISNADTCFVLSVMLLIGIGYIDLYGQGYLLNTVSFIIIYLYAPYGFELIRDETREEIYIFKIVSLLLIITSFFINNDIITFAFFLQSLTIVDKQKKM